MKSSVLVGLSLALAGVCSVQGQQNQVSAGTYFQDFNTLAIAPATGNAWVNGTTVNGWYLSKSVPPDVVSNYRADNGGANAGSFYSFGASGSGDRALGSIASGTPGTNAFGVLFYNDTAFTVSVTFGYTGEQWRNGGNVNPQTLGFGYRMDTSIITSPDAINANVWTPYTPLDFTSPTFGATATALDGNAAANSQVFAPQLIVGLDFGPGKYLMLRFGDPNDPSNDHGYGIDNVSVSFTPVPEPSVASFVAMGLLGCVVLVRRRSASSRQAR